MDILMVAQYFGNIEQLDKGNNRFVYLSSLLAKKHSVEVLTTSFVHASKTQGKNIPKEYNGVKITALNEPGYKKNVCLKRFYSHKVLAKNMKKYLENRKTPDVIYCAVPSLDCACMAAKFAKKNNVPFIIDVQDLWPEAFKMVLPMPKLWDVLLYSMKKKADYIYSNADSIVGVSKMYCDRAKSVNRIADSFTVYLGTNLDTFDSYVKDNAIKRDNDNFVVGYCGTLGHSYDLRCAFDALEIVQDKGYKNIELWVMGDGPLYDTFKTYADSKSINVRFMGRLPYGQMCGYLSSCDVTINPITKGAAQSIINKHADYAAVGRAVINTQECAEYRDLLDSFSCGINCNCSDAQSVAQAIIYLMEHKNERLQMGINSRKMAEDLFDRKKTYADIERIIRKYQLS